MPCSAELGDQPIEPIQLLGVEAFLLRLPDAPRRLRVVDVMKTDDVDSQFAHADCHPLGLRLPRKRPAETEIRAQKPSTFARLVSEVPIDVANEPVLPRRPAAERRHIHVRSAASNPDIGNANQPSGRSSLEAWIEKPTIANHM